MRYEIKVPVKKYNIHIMDEYLSKLRGLKKQHNERELSSIYYDSDKLSLARLNIEGISERYKFRVRWYNNNKSKFRYEIKKRKNKVGTKITFNSNLDLNNIDISKLFSNDSSISKKLYGNEKFIIKNYNLLPKININYKRKYFIYKNKIRITYDYPPTYQLVNKKSKEICDDSFIIEFKFSEDNYYEAVSLINSNYFHPQRYSKYLKGLALLNEAQYF